MTTYAMVIDGQVRSHFKVTDGRTAQSFRDVAHLLVEAPDDVQDGMVYDGKAFSLPVIEPTPVDPRDALLDLIASKLLDNGTLQTVDVVATGVAVP